MARRKKTSPLEDLIKITSLLPWYVGIALAIVSYLIFSHFAVSPEVTKGGGITVISSMLLPQLVFFFSSVAQYILPLIFFVATGISFFNQSRNVKPIEPSPWLQPRGKFKGNRAAGIEDVTKADADKEGIAKPTRWSLDLIREIEWRAFETLSAEYFKAKNYKVLETGAGKDGGVDFYLYKPASIDGQLQYQKPLGAVQCKSWQSQKVGVKTVRELYGVMAAESITLGVVVASGSFTEDAVSFAKGKRVQLIDGDKLFQLIIELPVDTQNGLLEKVVTEDYTTPSCPSCDIKLVTRTVKKGKNIGSSFWGCSNFPSCRYTLRS